jgi:triacylglycerol lipase
MLSGRSLVIYGLYVVFIQIPTYLIIIIIIQKLSIPKQIYITDIIITLLTTLILLINGMLKLLFTSRRLAILKRHSVAFMAFIPVMNIFIMLYACSIATIEYENESYKEIKDKAHVDSDICKTKYPIVLVHGFAFRDLRDANYWGRIPNVLIRNGADIYYGNQDAWGTIEHNAQCLKDSILDIVKTTGCEKVNIIAHSKGGLDSRYMLAKLDMGDYVSSLTTMASPHRGSTVMNIGYKLPDKIYRFIANFFDNSFRFLGDEAPDFYTAGKQLSTYNTKKFNDEVTDVAQVYYQSYTTVMSSIFSDYILSIPYIFLKFAEGENDGLVSIDSAKWGEFKGVFKTNHTRGISHGDIIDFRRDDYKEFNVLEKYVEIVSELKNKGY